ncbi:MAG: hypothetical protein ACI9DO_001232 [Reinekea sp.]|jgi:hypothetical protein
MSLGLQVFLITVAVVVVIAIKAYLLIRYFRNKG